MMTSILKHRIGTMGICTLSVFFGALLGSATAEAQETRLTLFARADYGDHTFFVGSPIELEISIVNRTIEDRDATALAAWRDQVERLGASGVADAALPMRPAAQQVTPDMEVDLGETSLEWFDDVRIELRPAEGSGAQVELTGRSYLSPIVREQSGSFRLGRDPQFTLLDLPEDITRGCAPGPYVFHVNSHRWGSAELLIEIRPASGPSELAIRARNRAVRALRFDDALAAIEHGERAAEYEPDHLQNLYLLGVAHERAGHTDDAIAALSQFRQRVVEGGRRACFQTRIAEETLSRATAAKMKTDARSALRPNNNLNTDEGASR